MSANKTLQSNLPFKPDLLPNGQVRSFSTLLDADFQRVGIAFLFRPSAQGKYERFDSKNVMLT